MPSLQIRIMDNYGNSHTVTAKECPCGGIVRLRSSELPNANIRHWIECAKCGKSSYWYSFVQDAVNDWNERITT